MAASIGGRRINLLLNYKENGFGFAAYTESSETDGSLHMVKPR
jgi:hypothetical protein